MNPEDGFMFSPCGCHWVGSSRTWVSSVYFCPEHKDRYHIPGASKEQLVQNWIDDILELNRKKQGHDS